MTLTLAEWENSERRGAEKARVNAIELGMEHTVQLRVLRWLLAERRRGCDTVDVESVTRVLRISNRVVDEGLLIDDAGRLGEIDHRVSIYLLCAGVRVCEEGVDAIDTGERDTGLVGGYVAAADETEILPALRDGGKVGLSDTLGDGRFGEASLEFGAFGFGCARWRSNSLATRKWSARRAWLDSARCIRFEVSRACGSNDGERENSEKEVDASHIEEFSLSDKNE